jgi:protein ImuB
LIGRDGRRRVICAADANARSLGLYVGMPATQAQALVAGLVMQDAQPLEDLAALDRLALWALQRYCPIVAADPPDGLVMDTTGSDHLHGGEAAMLAGMIDRFAGAGFLARAAIADSWGAAHALARFLRSPTIICPPGAHITEIAALPLTALRLDNAIVKSLRVLGFEHIGDLTAQPRAPLTLRFGPQLGLRLDQAMGVAPELIDPVRAPGLVEVERVFAEPIAAAETIARYIGKLVAMLCASLEQKGHGARTLDLLITGVDNSRQAIRVGMAKPVRDVKRLTRLLCDKIEVIDPAFGIERLQLAAVASEPIVPRQMTSSLVAEPDVDIGDLIDTLSNRIGERRLYRFAPIASDVPERSVQKIAPMSPDGADGWPMNWPRPTRLLDQPEPIEALALLPDNPPVTFTWRGIRRRVKRADGPERVFGEWWKRDAELIAVRDYFQVEDEAGERFWIYRAGDGENPATGSHRWFMHGIFA